MPIEKNKGMKVEIRNNMIDILINVSMKRRNVWIALVLCICVFILLASSLNDEIRNIIIEALLWALQALLLGKVNTKHDS